MCFGEIISYSVNISSFFSTGENLLQYIHMNDQTTQKQWYKKTWGVIVLILLSLIFLFVLYFAYKVYTIARDISNGTIATQKFTNAESLPTATIQGNIITTDDPSFGTPGAPITIVEFADFECPYCAQAFPTIRELQTEYQGKIHYIWRDFPLSSIHPNAQKAAEAGECAQDQGKFWELHDKMFINQDSLSVISLKQYARQLGMNGALFDECLDSGRYEHEVQADLADGVSLGVRGTPTFFINGNLVSGVIPKEDLMRVLDQLLAE